MVRWENGRRIELNGRVMAVSHIGTNTMPIMMYGFWSNCESCSDCYQKGNGCLIYRCKASFTLYAFSFSPLPSSLVTWYWLSWQLNSAESLPHRCRLPGRSWQLLWLTLSPTSTIELPVQLCQCFLKGPVFQESKCPTSRINKLLCDKNKIKIMLYKECPCFISLFLCWIS